MGGGPLCSGGEGILLVLYMLQTDITPALWVRVIVEKLKLERDLKHKVWLKGPDVEEVKEVLL